MRGGLKTPSTQSPRAVFVPCLILQLDLKERFMRLLLSAVASLGLASAAHATLLVTEVNSNQSSGSPAGLGDFWELTNFGASSVNLDGYTWDDNSFNPNDPAAVAITGISIEPGESIIFTGSSSADVFRTYWNVPATVQVYASPDGPGLGQNDGVALFDASDTEVIRFEYGAGKFVRSDGSNSVGGHAGPSAGASVAQISVVLDPSFPITAPRYTFAQENVFAAYRPQSNFLEVGSPGFVNVIPEPATLGVLAGLGLVALRRR
jgi:hypothetical protein